MEFDSVEKAIQDIRRGRMIIVVDDKNRENEGDLVFAASRSTAPKINFLAKHARGLICVALSPERADSLDLNPMVLENDAPHETAFTVSVEAKQGVTTGISAADRSLTAKLLADPNSRPNDFSKPGHIFPLRAKKGGVLVRAGHTEAAVDLVQLAGQGDAGVICEIMNENGTMARLKDCLRFSQKHRLTIISVQDLIAYRRLSTQVVQKVASPSISTPYGTFQANLYKDVLNQKMHIALVKGSISPKKIVSVRVHSESFLDDVFHGLQSNSNQKLQAGLQMIGTQGGIFLYMRRLNSEEHLLQQLIQYQDGPEKGGNPNKFQPKQMISDGDLGGATEFKYAGAAMDDRTYGIGAQILFDLGARRLELISDHPRTLQGLAGYGLKIVKQTGLAGIKTSPKKKKAAGKKVVKKKAKRAKKGYIA